MAWAKGASSSWKMPSAKCKLCPAELPSFEKLKSHWRAEHPRQYVVVRTWLADVDEAEVVAEIVAKEGMKGGWAGEDKGS
jgi:hypothetical protein